MFDRELYFDFAHSVNGFEAIVDKRIRLSRQELKHNSKTMAIAKWLLSPFYVYAWNLAFKHLGTMTDDEIKDMFNYLDAVESAGLPDDEAKDAQLVYDPAYYLGKRLSYQRVSRFFDFLSAHRHAIAVQLYKYAHDPRVVSASAWNHYRYQKHQNMIEKRQ